MNEDILREFDAGRDFSQKAFRSACYAPFVSLYFDQLGFVRVCCQNGAHSLGNLATNSLDEIWNGSQARVLRSALKKYNFNLGCQYCQWQISDGNYTGFLRQFDRWPVESTTDFWPAQMEFSISNTCNLECVMCNGEWSSAIRARREKLPPLRKVYGERFYADLEKYLPHLRNVKFLGGEPFLAQESFRIWDMMIGLGLETPCHVTTNGTHYNAKIERVLEKLPFSFCISMDGVTKETVESIRVNARFEELRANFLRFLDYTKRRGTSLTLTYCLMPQNWHEFGAYLLFADEHECNVCVNTVLHPAKYSLYQMSAAQLGPIVAALDRESETLLPRLGRNREFWVQEIDRLRHRLRETDSAPLSFVPGSLAPAAGGLPIVSLSEAEKRAEASRRLEEWSGQAVSNGLVCDNQDMVLDLLPGTDDFFGIPKDQCVGRPIDDLYARIRMRFGGMTGVHRRDQGPFVDRFFGLTSLELKPRCLRFVTFPRSGDPSGSAGTLTLAAMVDRPLAEVAR